MNYQEKFNSYMRLQKKYQQSISATINPIHFNTNKNKNNNYKCIHCGKKGGTNFYIKDNTYYATCNSITTKCKLNLILKRPIANNINSLHRHTTHKSLSIFDNIIYLVIGSIINDVIINYILICSSFSC